MNTVYRSADDGICFSHFLDERPESAGFHMHAHDQYEILYFLSGVGNYLVESASYPLRPHCTLLMRPGEVHRVQIEPDTPYERIVLQFREDAITGVNAQTHRLLYPFEQRPLGTGNQYEPEEYDSDFVRHNLLHIERMNGTQLADITVTAVLPAILTEFARCSLARQTGSAPPAEDTTRIRAILTYINDNLFGDITLDTLCDRFYISKTQLGRLVSAATGSTPWEYITVKRLIEARRRIISGEPAAQVANECGFRDYSAFFRAYKKRYGTAPTADRRLFRE